MNAPTLWHCRRFQFNLATPLVMGIVNLTTDSFSGDGLMHTEGDWVLSAMNHARHQWLAGAHILDIGAQSSRPGAHRLSAHEEWQRLAPVLREVCAWPIAISVDTFHAEVMRRAIDAGCDIINNIEGFHDDSSWKAVAESSVGVVIMHMQGTPATMQQAPSYINVVDEVAAFLRQKIDEGIAQGVSAHRMAIDPGFGFGKKYAHNTALFQSLSRLAQLHAPLLIGVSRKKMVGDLTALPMNQRAWPSVVAALLAVQQGAHIVRVHDVAETVMALKMAHELLPSDC